LLPRHTTLVFWQIYFNVSSDGFFSQRVKVY
jgi:hypothetical protein